jgi:protoheme IX farnesyltransferase
VNVKLQSACATFPLYWARTADYVELTKPGITFLVTITALVGFYLGAPSPIPLLRLSHTLLGTALVAAGASALNMYVERYHDALMRRTQDRPLPAGRMASTDALVFGSAMCFAGVVYLLACVNALTSVVSIVTAISYVGVYTPLKRKTWLCTAIGAVPGALPAVMGWAAATGSLSVGGWVLFSIVFLWQTPHFYAVGWMYREDYARAAFSILPVVDEDGSRTGRQIFGHLLLLWFVSLLPFATGMAGWVYFIGASALSLLFFLYGAAFARLRNRPSARRLFFFSIVYLPAVHGLLIFDKIAI